jgi:hypothetical protein
MYCDEDCAKSALLCHQPECDQMTLDHSKFLAFHTFLRLYDKALAATLASDEELEQLFNESQLQPSLTSTLAIAMTQHTKRIS